VQQPATNNVGVVSTTLTKRLTTAISIGTRLCSLRLRKLVPDTRQDVVEGVETFDRREEYDQREQSCTSDEAQTAVKRKSRIDCAAACNEQSECREYNFDETTKDCSLYKHQPIYTTGYLRNTKWLISFPNWFFTLKCLHIARKTHDCSLYKCT